MYKALEVEFINEFTKAGIHKISLKKPTLYGKLHIPEPVFTKKRFYVALEKMIFIGKNDILENHSPKCGWFSRISAKFEGHPVGENMKFVKLEIATELSSRYK